MLTVSNQIKLPIRVATVLLSWISQKNFLFKDQDFTQSGISLSYDQSPPPITLPALAIPNFIFLFLKKDLI